MQTKLTSAQAPTFINKCKTRLEDHVVPIPNYYSSKTAYGDQLYHTSLLSFQQSENGKVHVPAEKTPL